MDKKNILVIGGAGFIGSNLIRKLLLEKNLNVICLDNLSTGRFENINEFLRYHNFKFIKFDITKPIDLEKINEISDFKIDILGIHKIYFSAFNFEKISMFKIFTTGLLNSLEIAKKYSASFLLFSSGEYYGEESKMFKETETSKIDPFLNFGWRYELRRFSEIFSWEYSQKNNIKIKIFRLFNVYGEGENIYNARFLPLIFKQVLSNSKIKISDLDAKLNLIYIKDTISAILKISDNLDSDIINIGSFENYLIKEIIESAIKFTNSNSEIILGESEFEYIKPFPDITKLKTEYNYIPQTSIEQGLKNTFDYLLIQYKKAKSII